MSTERKRCSLEFVLSSFKVHHLVGGLCGGVAATLITHPFDLIKLRLAGKCLIPHVQI